MTEWQARKLGEVITLQRGYDLTQKDASPGPYPVISSGGSSYTTKEPKAAGPGVVTGRKGLLGKVYYSETPYWPHDTTLWVKDFKGTSPRFVYYLLQTLPLAGLDAGASNPTLNRNHAHLLPVAVPSPQTQQQIADILGSLDDLIENNRRQVEVLEEMARAIYREWFVHFRFPGHEDTTFVDSDLGPIPEGWLLTPLSQVADITMGQSPKSEFYNDDGIGLPFHQGVTHFGTHFPNHVKYCSLEGRIAEEHDILVSVRAPVGRLNIADCRLVIGRGLAAVRSKHGQQGLLLGHLQAVFHEEDSMGGGTIFKAITKADLLKVPIFDVPSALASMAEQHLGRLRSAIQALTHSANHLAEIRDLLLPKLVTGQIDVSDLDLEAVVEQAEV